MDLSEKQIAEVKSILRNRCKRWSDAAISSLIRIINELRSGNLKQTDFFVQECELTYLEMVCDLGLEGYAEV